MSRRIPSRPRQLAVVLASVFGLAAQCATATTLTVTTCVDDPAEAGSLRAIISQANAGDEIDLSTLSCSKISLAHGAIINHATSITLKGPSASVLTIDGNLADRVLAHDGSQTMTVRYLTITRGQYTKGSYGGGCIYALGDVYLDHSTVSNCYVYGTSTKGGGVYTHGTVHMVRSTVSGNWASHARLTLGSVGTGGGIYAGDGLYSKESTISDNNAGGFGAGAFVNTYAIVVGSTLSGNTVSENGGAAIGSYSNSATGTFVNSTIAHNTAGSPSGLLGHCYAVFFSSVFLYNSTVSANRCVTYFGGTLFSNKTLTSISSIIASNSPGTNTKDVTAGAITGNNNIIGTANVALPGDTITQDPQLQLLANNGGPTMTMAPKPTSPAINAGDNPLNLTTDQRGAGFPRVLGSAPDIGAFETGDEIFANGFQ